MPGHRLIEGFSSFSIVNRSREKEEKREKKERVRDILIEAFSSNSLPKVTFSNICCCCCCFSECVFLKSFVGDLVDPNSDSNLESIFFCIEKSRDQTNVHIIDPF